MASSLKMMADILRAVLVEILNDPHRAPALWPLARVSYPVRQLPGRQLPDGSISFDIALYGWEYKHRGPRPSKPPMVDTEGVRTALAAQGLPIVAVENCGKYIRITLEEALC